jgi:hypothetical protein
MKLFLYVAISILVSSCGHNPTVVNPNTPIPSTHKANIDPSLLTSCKPIPELSGNTELELITWIAEWKTAYLDCKYSKDALVSSIKAAFSSDSK